MPAGRTGGCDDDSGRTAHDSRVQRPVLPPSPHHLLMSSIRAAGSMALIMSNSVSAATLTAVRASIRRRCDRWFGQFAAILIAASWTLKSTSIPLSGSGGRADQVAGLRLAASDPGYSGGRERIALGRPPAEMRSTTSAVVHEASGHRCSSGTVLSGDRPCARRRFHRGATSGAAPGGHRYLLTTAPGAGRAGRKPVRGTRCRRTAKAPHSIGSQSLTA